MSNYTSAEELRRTFQEYVQYNQRDLEVLRQRTLRKLTFELYKAAKAVAPTPEDISSKVKSLGWRVVKKGTPEEWGKSASRSIPKNSMRGMNKAERIAEKQRRTSVLASIDDQEKMQAFVIKKRASKIGFMASGYALAARLLGFNIAPIRKVNAKAAASDDGTTTKISVTAGGIEIVDDGTGFVKKAIESTVADIRKYIYARQQAGRARFSR